MRAIDQNWVNYSGGGTTSVDEYQYGYNAQGNVTFRKNVVAGTHNLDQLYSYDGLGQLTSLAQGRLASGNTSLTSGTQDFTQSWTLDGQGNWSSFVQSNNGSTTSLNQSRTVDGTNEITAFTTTTGSAWATPVYDLNGNMTTVPMPGSETTGLTAKYDGWNRLVSVKNGATTLATYAYDGQNRLISVTESSVTTVNYYAGDQLVQSVVGLPSSPVLGSTYTTHQFVWSPRDVNALMLRTDTTFTYNGSAWMAGTPTTYYFLADANNNVTAVLNSAGAVQERYSYDAYGHATIYTSTWGSRSSTSVGNNVLFAGMAQDNATGLYYARARWYNPSTGGFITQDPAQYDSNLYRYSNNNPISWSDPSGQSGGTDGGFDTLAIQFALAIGNFFAGTPEPAPPKPGPCNGAQTGLAGQFCGNQSAPKNSPFNSSMLRYVADHSADPREPTTVDDLLANSVLREPAHSISDHWLPTDDEWLKAIYCGDPDASDKELQLAMEDAGGQIIEDTPEAIDELNAMHNPLSSLTASALDSLILDHQVDTVGLAKNGLGLVGSIDNSSWGTGDTNGLTNGSISEVGQGGAVPAGLIGSTRPDLAWVNPGGYTENCAWCAKNLDEYLNGGAMTPAGDCTPMGFSSISNGMGVNLSDWQHGLTSEELIAQLQASGNRANAIIWGHWGNPEVGHFFNAFNNNGDVQFICGQNACVINPELLQQGQMSLLGNHLK